MDRNFIMVKYNTAKQAADAFAAAQAKFPRAVSRSTDKSCVDGSVVMFQRKVTTALDMTVEKFLFAQSGALPPLRR